MATPRAKPLKQPLQQRSRQTVQAILEAAIQVFEVHGYAAGTTSRIAQRAGVSIGSLYQYFPNKDEILFALAQQHLAEGLGLSARLLETLRQANLSLEATLREIVSSMIALHKINPGLHRLLYEEALLPVGLRLTVKEAEVFLIQEVARCLSLRPDVSSTDSQLQAYFVVHTIEHFTHKLVIDQPSAQFQKAGEEEMVQMLLRYLRADN
ncbi:TetR/AcrR family transcriptional regulator [Undibacterium sp. TJN19]|uniref:TetR/AcrR family transcriptional regulator n=1 Tax=Undibacterium sp. TJN19 TaxID=3413055 RepID=UPI003BF1AB2A